MRKHILIIIMLLMWSIYAVGSISFGSRIDRGVVEENELNEISGLVISGRDSQVLWTHNDSGGDNAIYAMTVFGEHLGKYYLEGIELRDVEDIAVGSGPEEGESYLYLADVGDNSGIYEEKYIYRIVEPEVDEGQNPVIESISFDEIETIAFSYSGGERFDSETVILDNLDIWVISKRNPENPFSGAADGAFLLSYPQDTVSLNYAQEMCSIAVPDYQGYGITGGDLCDSGLELLLRTYDAVYYWERGAEEDLVGMLSGDWQSVSYELEPQGEAVCWQQGAQGYFCCGEEYGSYPAHLSYYARLSSYIQISHLPTGLYKSDEELEIIWEPEGLYNQLYISEAPGGEILENYEASGIWGEDIILSTPSALGLSVGIYRGILYNPQYNYLSIEFPLIVESNTAPVMTLPSNSSTISSPLPVFQWQENPGVPYYFIVVSDTPFLIEHDENGDPVVTGIETVWQAITYETGIMYGMPDPSGYFEGSAPPLIAGNEYNWIVANNYGNDPLLTSKVAGSPHSFYYSSENMIDAVLLQYPVENSILSSSEINFSWTELEEALYYQIQVFEIREEGNNSGNYLVWDQVTTNTGIEMNASAILIASDYNWKVYATSGEDVSSVSESGHFVYDIAVGTLNLHVRDNYGSAVPFASADLDPIEGSGDDFPLAINENGNETKTIPVGEYTIGLSKDGYEAADTTFVIAYGEVTTLTVEMAYSPSNFYGRVTDEEGYNLANVRIIAESATGEEREVTSINGNYLLSVVEGDWTISASKKGWVCDTEIECEIEPGENLELADIMLYESGKSMQGHVRNTSGMPLMNCHVTASLDGKIFHTVSNENGFYEYSGVEMGIYTVSANKPGYSVINPEIVEISAASEQVTVVEDLLLQPSALINGTARNGLVGLKDVTITAVPSAGEIQEAVTDEYGDYRMNLLAGNYYLGAYREHYSSQTTYQVNLEVGETLDNLDFLLLPNDGVIRGRIESEGVGLAGVQVTAGENHVLSDNEGEYSLTVYPGTYNLEAFRSGYTADREYRISVSSDQILTGMDFEMYPNASMINGQIHQMGIMIAGAEVFAERQSGGHEQYVTGSGNNGAYSFSLLHGNYKLWAEKQNFVCMPTDTVYTAVAPGEEISGIDINLTPVEAYIEGRVLNSEGLGLEGADVLAGSELHFYGTVSGRNGGFSLVVSPEAVYEITASKYGYSTESVLTEALEIGEETFVEIRLEQLPSTVSGRVYNQEGTAVQGATITCSGESTYSTESSINGSWLLGIFAGPYHLSAAKPGYLEDEMNIVLVPGSQLDSLDFYLEENFAVLQGRIINENTLEGLEEVLVTANHTGGGGGSGFTDEEGHYLLEGLLPGMYESIIFSKTGYYSQIETGVLLPGSSISTMDVMLEPYTAAIRSEVRYLGEGMSGATLTAENLSSGEVVYDLTDEEGVSFITDLASLMPYQVSVSLPSYTASDTLVYPIPGDTLQLEFDLVRIDGMIYGFVYDQENDPVSLAEVTATSADGYQGSCSSSATGSYVIDGLAVGRSYRLEVEKEGYSLEEEIEIYLSEAPEQVDLTIYEHIYQISGVLVDQAGIELEGILVHCDGMGQSDYSITGADGSFILGPLAPFMSYHIYTSATEAGYENISWQEELASADLYLGEVLLPVHLSIIRGVVSDIESGNPLGEVVIAARNQESGQVIGAVSQVDGSYHLRYLYEGNYELQCAKESYADLEIDSVYIGHREEVDLDLEMQYNEPLLIGGWVKDTSQRPQPEVAINIINNSFMDTVYTNSEGYFLFEEGVAYSSIIITTNLDPYDYDNAWVEYNAGIEDTLDVLLEIDVHNASLCGTVYSDGSGLANVEVSIATLDSIWSVITPAGGEYCFDQLYEGWYAVSCHRPGWELYDHLLEVEDGDIIIHDVNLQQVEGSIYGVVSSETEPYLPGTVVWAELDGEIAAMDSSSSGGAYLLSDLAVNEQYLIRAAKLGFAAYISSDSVMVGDAAVDIILNPVANSISGTVYLGGESAAGAEVVIRDQNMNMQETVTNEFGDYLFSNLTGYRDIWARLGDEYTSISAGVEVPVGGAVRYYPELIDAGSISGSVFYVGEPKPGVTVVATNTASGRWYLDITEEDGLFELRGLAAGNYQLSGFCQGYEFLDLPGEILLEAGEDIILPGVNLLFMENSISGVVQRINSRIGIAGAEVILYDSLHIELAEYITEADGTFLFSNLADGRYLLAAGHEAYEQAAEIEVVLTGGAAEPPTADFNLIPQELLIYGNVHSDNGLPLPGVLVEAELRSDIFARKSLVNKLSVRTISDSTDGQGFYEIQADTVGIWQMRAQKPGYYAADPVNVELNWEEPFYEQDFYMQKIVQYADIRGSVKIWDEGWQPPDQFTVALTSQSGADSLQQFSFPDSNYIFEGLEVPDVFTLEVSASYGEAEYHEYRPDISIEESAEEIENFSFAYIPETYGLSGFVKMNDAGIYPLAEAEVQLMSGADSLITLTSSNGYYHFGNLPEGDYQLKFEAEYDDELFIYNSPWLHLSSSRQYNHTFVYLLAEIGFEIFGAENAPVSDLGLLLRGDDFSLNLTTDEMGEASTNPVLHTGIYELMMNPSGSALEIYLAPEPVELDIPSLDYYQYQKQLPLWLEKSDYQEEYSFDSEIPVYLYKSEGFMGIARLYYQFESGAVRELEMYSDTERFYETIPSQSGGGRLIFWIRVEDIGSGENYSNQSNPWEIDISTAGIPDLESSYILPANPVIPYNTELELSLVVKDEPGNILNEEILASGSVNWVLADEESGELIVGEDNPLQAVFQSAWQESEETEVEIRAEIEFQEFILDIDTEVITGNFEIGNILINGDYETANNSISDYMVQIYSEEGRLLNLPWTYENIDPAAGLLSSLGNILTYEPEDDFLGRISLNVKAWDPLTDNYWDSQLPLIVYDLVNASTTASVLTTTAGCEIILYDNMLKNQQTQAKLYLLPVEVSPYEEVGVEYETASLVFIPNSDYSESAFNHLPGLQFDGADDEIVVARWDQASLSWQILARNGGLLEHIDIFASHYSALKYSDELGIYDLKLLPNPFTPYDRVGENMGLQIQFRLASPQSRYVNITARIYTVNGELVREIARSKPFLKGEYEAGETASLYWDGYTEGNKLARNGRYLVHLIAEDSDHKKELIKTVVLIK